MFGKVQTMAEGDAGVYQTLAAMRALVYQAAASPLVRAWAVEIARTVPPRSPAALAGAIRQFLSERVSYLDDPVGVELVHAPERLLDEIGSRYYVTGDCDDVATLGAALAASVGLPSRFVVLSFGGPGDPFQHVYAELWTGDGWAELDTTRQLAEVQRAAIISRRLIVPGYPVDFQV